MNVAVVVNNNAELIAVANEGKIDSDEIVWRGDDGSFVIGDNWDYSEVFTTYEEAGTLGEYATVQA